MKRSETLRLHLLDVLYDIAQYTALLLVPLLRGLFSVGDGWRTWVAGVWLDLMAVALMLILGALRWQRGRIFLSTGRLCYARGLVFRKESVFYARHLATLRLIRPMLLRPFGAMVVMPVPVGPVGRERRPMIVSVRSASKMQSALLPAKGRALGEYRPVAREVAFFTALHSRAGAGLAFLAAFLSASGKLLGRDFSAELYGVLARVARFMADKLPPSAVLFGGVLLLGYVASFVRGVLEYRRFSVVSYPELFWISGGLFPRYTYAVYKREVSSVFVRFRLISRLLGRFSLLIGVPGYGGKTFPPVLVQSAGAKAMFAALRRLAPECPAFYCPVRTQRQLVWWSFLRWPCLLALFCLAFMALVFWQWPDFRSLALLWGGMTFLWVLWLAGNAVCALFHTGIGAASSGLVLRYARRRAFYRVFLPYGKIIRLSLLQSPAQEKKGLCSVLVFEKGTGRKHVVRGLSAKEVEALGISGRIDAFYAKK